MEISCLGIDSASVYLPGLLGIVKVHGRIVQVIRLILLV